MLLPSEAVEQTPFLDTLGLTWHDNLDDHYLKMQIYYLLFKNANFWSVSFKKILFSSKLSVFLIFKVMQTSTNTAVNVTWALKSMTVDQLIYW